MYGFDLVLCSGVCCACMRTRTCAQGGSGDSFGEGVAKAVLSFSVFYMVCVCVGGWVGERLGKRLGKRLGEWLGVWVCGCARVHVCACGCARTSAFVFVMDVLGWVSVRRCACEYFQTGFCVAGFDSAA